MISRKSTLVASALALLIVSLACGLANPIRQRIAAEPETSQTPTRTPRPTFTSTPNWTPTPSVTPTSTPTLIPTHTPTPTPPPATETFTPVPPTATFTPAPPTATFTPAPPTATFTPAPPTATPTPSYQYKVVEGPTGFPTTNSILVIYVAIHDANNTPIGGLKVIADHSPSGVHKESDPTCYSYCKPSGMSGTVKVGNTVIEWGGIETGTWTLRVVDGGGTQVAAPIIINTDSNAPQWYFVRLQG